MVAVEDLWKLMIENQAVTEPDVALVGAGIMSATLGVFLKEFEPALDIVQSPPLAL